MVKVKTGKNVASVLQFQETQFSSSAEMKICTLSKAPAIVKTSGFSNTGTHMQL